MTVQLWPSTHDYWKGPSISALSERLFECSPMQAKFDVNHHFVALFLFTQPLPQFQRFGCRRPKHVSGVLSTPRSVTQWRVHTCLLLMKHRCSRKMSMSWVKPRHKSLRQTSHCVWLPFFFLWEKRVSISIQGLLYETDKLLLTQDKSRHIRLFIWEHSHLTNSVNSVGQRAFSY